MVARNDPGQLIFLSFGLAIFTLFDQAKKGGGQSGKRAGAGSRGDRQLEKPGRASKWCTRLGSNQQPLPSEGSTLSIELRMQLVGF